MREADIQSKVFQIIVDGVPGDIRDSFHTTMKRIGYLLAKDMNKQTWKELAEFEGQINAELAGSFYHRIRYAMLDDEREFKINEHVIFKDPTRPSLQKTINIKHEFDPDFEIQVGLNTVARGIEHELQAGAKLEAILKGHISYARSSNSDEQIVETLKQTRKRMTSGNSKFSFENISDPKAFLDRLPTIARERFDELLSQMTLATGRKLG